MDVDLVHRSTRCWPTGQTGTSHLSESQPDTIENSLIDTNLFPAIDILRDIVTLLFLVTEGMFLESLDLEIGSTPWPDDLVYLEPIL